MSAQAKSSILPQPRAAWWRRQLSARGQFFGAVAVLFILLFLRRPDALLNAQFWAEDGAIFWSDQILYGFWASALTPYQGYLHLTIRLIMVPISLLPTYWAPLLCNLAGLLIAATCCGLFVLPGYRYVLPSDRQRFLVAVLAASVPYCDELPGNLTNLHWYLAVGAVLIVFRPADPNTPPGVFPAVLIGAAGAMIGCSSPLCLFLLPLLLWKLLLYRSTHRIWLGLMAVGIIVQIITALVHRLAPTASVSLDQVLVASMVAFAYRVILSTVVGVRGAAWAAQNGLSSILLLTLVSAILWLHWLCRAGDVRTRRSVIGSLYVLFSSLGVVLIGRPANIKAFGSLSAITEWRGERYFFLPACILILLVALSIKTFLPSARTTVTAMLLCTAFSAGLLANFRIPAYVDLHWASYVGQIDSWRKAWFAGQPVQGIGSAVVPPGWPMWLPARLAAVTKDSPWEGCVLTERETAFRRRDAALYFVEGGRKRHIVDAKWLTEHGFRWPQDLVFTSRSDLAGIPLGAPLGQ